MISFDDAKIVSFYLRSNFLSIFHYSFNRFQHFCARAQRLLTL